MCPWSFEAANHAVALRSRVNHEGFAFVEFATAEEASKAVEQFHNKEFQGRALTVNVARPREERPPRWSGGGRDEARSERR